MLVQFTIKNFRSILNEKTFSMQTAPYLKKYRESNTFNTKPLNLLKCSAIFGPNGSGKTNIIKGIDTLRSMILNSYRVSAQKSVKLPFQPFKMKQNETTYTKFAIILMINSTLYEYECRYNAEMILYETLKVLTNENDRIIYLREYNNNENKYDYIINNSPDYSEKTKKNVLYLTVLNEFSDDFKESEAKDVYNWFLNNLVIIEANEDSIPDSLLEKLDDKRIKESLLQFLKIADFNIIDIDTRKRREEVPEHLKSLFNSEFNQELEDFFEFTDVYTIYNKYDINDEIIGTSDLHVQSFESRGTIKMIILALVLLDATRESKTVFIDEFDNALHYEISVFLLKLFNNEVYNKKSQFIINTHDLSLIDSEFLRVDQVWFSEKSKQNVTDYYSLYDFNGTNNSARIDVSNAKKYLEGKFGALPIINESLFIKNIFNIGE